MSTNFISTSSLTLQLGSHGDHGNVKAQIRAANVVSRRTKGAPAIDPAQCFSKLQTFKYGFISRARTKSGNLVQVKASSAPNNSSPSWQKWVLGILMTVILPVVGYKGGLLSNLKSRIDRAVEIVGNLARVVEEVGEGAEKILEEVEEKLPNDSKLKEKLESFDDLAKKAVSEARKAEDVVHKVKDVEEQIEETIRKSGRGTSKK